jgi:hypothetical protein
MKAVSNVSTWTARPDAWAEWLVVPVENLRSEILVVQSAQKWRRYSS